MYKCSECGTEYETAPKYCDCGNDIFINVGEQDEFIPQEIDDEIEEPLARTSKYHGEGRKFRKKTYSPVGLSVFTICIILSLLVLFVIANPKKDAVNVQVTTESEEKAEIPSVESYWDNTPIKVAQREDLQPQKQDNILDKIVQQIVPQEQPQKEVKSVINTPVSTQKKKSQNAATQTQKTSQKQKTAKPVSTQTAMTFEDLTNKIRTQYPAQNTQTQQKQTVHTTTATNKSAPVPQTSSNTTKTTNNVAQTSTQTIPKTQTVTKSQTQSQIQTHSQTQVQNNTQSQTTTISQKSQAQLKQELASYKSGLRNTLGRKIDFTRVIGDGECSLSFKVNSNGRLSSKAFIKQSSNITLNDAVFNALNTMTSYNPPPEGYNGETLRLNIKFYNGNFEISLN